MPVAEYAEGIRRLILDTPHVVSHSLGYEARDLSTYPDHRHTPDEVHSSSAPALVSVLREAAAYVKRSPR